MEFSYKYQIVKFAILFIFIFQISLSQEITKTEFDYINNEIKNTLHSVKTSDDFHVLKKKFNFNHKDSELIDELMKEKSVEFSKTRDTRDVIIPFYKFTDKKDELLLTIYSVTLEYPKDGESFSRGNYYFVLTTTVKIENTKLVCKSTNLIVSPESIIQWFLDGLKNDYVGKTAEVKDKFGFMPPPPAPPPKEL